MSYFQVLNKQNQVLDQLKQIETSIENVRSEYQRYASLPKSALSLVLNFLIDHKMLIMVCKSWLMVCKSWFLCLFPDKSFIVVTGKFSPSNLRLPSKESHLAYQEDIDFSVDNELHELISEKPHYWRCLRIVGSKNSEEKMVWLSNSRFILSISSGSIEYVWKESDCQRKSHLYLPFSLSVCCNKKFLYHLVEGVLSCYLLPVNQLSSRFIRKSRFLLPWLIQYCVAPLKITCSETHLFIVANPTHAELYNIDEKTGTLSKTSEPFEIDENLIGSFTDVCLGSEHILTVGKNGLAFSSLEGKILGFVKRPTETIRKVAYSDVAKDFILWEDSNFYFLKCLTFVKRPPKLFPWPHYNELLEQAQRIREEWYELAKLVQIQRTERQTLAHFPCSLVVAIRHFLSSQHKSLTASLCKLWAHCVKPVWVQSVTSSYYRYNAGTCFGADSVLNSHVNSGSMTFRVNSQNIVAYEGTETKRIASLQLPLLSGQARMMCASRNSQRTTIVILEPPRTLIILFWEGQDFILKRISLFPEKLLNPPHILTASDRFIYVEPTPHHSCILDLNGEVLYSKPVSDSSSATFLSSQLLIVYGISRDKYQMFQITEFFAKSPKTQKKLEICKKCGNNVSDKMLYTCRSCTTTCCIPCLSMLDFCLSCARPLI